MKWDCIILYLIIIFLYEKDTSTIVSIDLLIKKRKHHSTSLFSTLNTWLKYINYLLY